MICTRSRNTRWRGGRLVAALIRTPVIFLVLSCLSLSAVADSGADPANLDEMTQGSDFVFECNVDRIDYRFATVSIPDGPTQTMPYTFVTCQVGNVYKGNTRNSTVTLRFAGGPGENVGEYVLYSGQPLFDVGDHDILFVSGNEQSPCPLVDCATGRLREMDGMVVDDSGRPVTIDGNGDIQPGQPLDLEGVNTHNMNDTVSLTRMETDRLGNPVTLADPESIDRNLILTPESFDRLLRQRVSELYTEEELEAMPEFTGADPDRPIEVISTGSAGFAVPGKDSNTRPANLPDYRAWKKATNGFETEAKYQMPDNGPEPNEGERIPEHQQADDSVAIWVILGALVLVLLIYFGVRRFY